MRLKFYSLSFCAGSLPDYVKSTKKLRNLASYEISSSLLEFDNTNISYELNLISENEEEIDFENYELWKNMGINNSKRE